jgi:hypothetical protein
MRRHSPSPAMVIACLALFIALGGTGYAASGALSDGGSPQATVARRARRSTRGPRGFRGRTGPKGATGPAGPQGAAGAQGPAGTAKAFAVVSSAGRVIAGHVSNITDANITHPSVGIYCFNLTGIGISQGNSVPLVVADWSDPATGSADTMEVAARAESNICPTNQIEIKGYDSAAALADLGFVVAFM